MATIATRQVLELCLSAAAYVAVDVAGRWPTDADVREIARLVSEQGTEVPLDQEDVYHYLSGAAHGFKSLPAALDQIWAAYEKAEALDVSVLPAVLVRSYMIEEAKEHGTTLD